MKKKLALLLALIMTLSLAPVTIFAASTNRLSRDTQTVPKETLMYDVNITSPLAAGTTHNLTGTKKTQDDKTISSYVPGMDLILEFKDSIKAGDAFRLTLDNAEWFFESDMAGHTQVAGTQAVAYDKTRMQAKAGSPYTYEFIGAEGIPYTITVSSVNRKSAVISFGADKTITSATSDIADKTVFVPMLVYIPDENVDVTVSLVDNSSAATAGSYLIASSRAGATTTTAVSIKSGRETIALDTVVIKENRTGSLNKSGAVELIAPSGYRFRDKFSTSASKITVSTEYGMGSLLSWGYKWTDTRDYTSVALYIDTTDKSTGKIPGAILLTGLEIEPLDYNAIPRIGETLSISIANYEVGGTFSTGGTRDASYSPTPGTTTTKLNVKSESFSVAKVVDWAVTMTAASPRSLISGRFPTNATDDSIKAAKVTFAEEDIGSWLSDRVTTFTLPEGVKITAVKFDTRTNLTTLPSTLVDVRNAEVAASRYVEDMITITEGSMSIRGLKSDSATVLSKMEFTLYLSIDPSYEGPITLTASGTALPQAEQTVTIANAMPAIVMTSKSKNVEVGFQSYAVNDITITETAAGALLRDEALNIKVHDYRDSNDIMFNPISAANYKVTEGNLLLTLLNTRNGIISFTVDRASTTPSTIELTNLEVRINRSVPYGTYDVSAYGSAVFNNFNFVIGNTRQNANLLSFYREDEGIILPGYIKVVSDVNEYTATQNNVKITANSNVIVVGNETITLDVAPFIDPTSNSFLVPVRFVATALGIPETNIFWDQNNMMVTIISADNTRTIQFQANSDIMYVNGARQTMVTNGYNVSARIVKDRMFIPFRYVGIGLGISNDKILWNEATQTAEFNPVSMD